MAESLLSLRDFLLVAVLLASAWTDLAERRIYNAFTYPACLAGVCLATMAGPASLAGSLGALAVAVAVFAPLVLAGGMGLGDLKLMGAVGALAGFRTGTAALIDAALAGGLMACALLAARGGVRATLRRSLAVPGAILAAWCSGGRRRLAVRAGDPTLPYGVAIAVGTLVARWTGWPW